MPNIYGNSEIWGDLIVTGSFSILGSASSIETTTLVVSDTIIAIGHSQSGTPILDEGLMFVRGTGLTQAFIWDESDDTFALIGTNDDHTVVGDVNINSYSNLRVGGLTTSSFKLLTGAADGYILSSDSNGLASWQAPGTTPSLSQVLTVGNSTGTNNIIIPEPAYLAFTSSVHTLRLYATTLNANHSIVMPNKGGTMALIQDIPSPGISGSGTASYLPKWSTSSQLTNSGIYDNGTTICLGQTVSTVDTLLYLKETTSGIKTGIYTEVSGSIPNVGMSSHVGSSLGFGTGDYAVVGNIGSSTVNESYSFYGSNGGSNIFNSYVYYATNTSNSPTKYGFYGTITGVGLSTQNYGSRLVVSGASITNYGNWNTVSGTAATNFGTYLVVSQATNTNTGIEVSSSGGNEAYGAKLSVGSGTLNTYGNYIAVSGTQSTSRKIGTFAIIADSDGVGVHNMGTSIWCNGGYKNSGGYFAVGSGYGIPNGDIAVQGRVSSVLTSSQSLSIAVYANNEDDRFLSTAYGFQASVTSNSNTNYGLYVDVYGATTNYGIVVNQGSSVFNELGIDSDFRIEGMTESNLFFVDASSDNIGIATSTPNYRLQVSGTVSTTGFRMTNAASNGYILVSDASGNASWEVGYTNLSVDIDYSSTPTKTLSTTITNGLGPFTYEWTTEQNDVLGYNISGSTTSSSIQISTGSNYFSGVFMGPTSGQVYEALFKVKVTDAVGQVSSAYYKVMNWTPAA